MYKYFAKVALVTHNMPCILTYGIFHNTNHVFAVGEVVSCPIRKQTHYGIILEILESITPAPTFEIHPIDPLSVNITITDSLMIAVSQLQLIYLVPVSWIIKLVFPKYILRDKKQNPTLALLLSKILFNHCIDKKSSLQDKKYLLKLCNVDTTQVQYINYIDSMINLFSLITKIMTINLKQILCTHIMYMLKRSLYRLNYSINMNQHSEYLFTNISSVHKYYLLLHFANMCMTHNKQLLIIIPDINRDQIFVQQLQSTLKHSCIILSDKMSLHDRRMSWHRMRSGMISIVIGDKSSVFNDLPYLGMIIIDKSDDILLKEEVFPPYYHTIQVASIRCNILQCPLIMISNVPQIDIYARCMIEKTMVYYDCGTLSIQKASATVSIVNRKLYHPSLGILSPPILSNIMSRLQSGQQCVIIFNKTGFKNYLYCDCSPYPIQCPECDIPIWLCQQQDVFVMKCWSCKKETVFTSTCNYCYGNMIAKIIGNQYLESKLKNKFPNFIVKSINDNNKLQNLKIIDEFNKSKIDIVVLQQDYIYNINTQHTLWCMLETEYYMKIPNLLSSEKTFYDIMKTILHAECCNSDRVLLQTSLPDHESIVLGSKKAFKEFFNIHIKKRELYGLPPFGNIIKCIVVATNKYICKSISDNIKEDLVSKFDIHSSDIKLQKINIKFHGYFFIKTKNPKFVYRSIKELQSNVMHKHTFITIDPYPLSFK